ncbi:MAG: hypothetical protein HY000_36730 [Planctomycetes bacterium]|nr:hypothetical protein [Planctomycetota bacterium]
MATPKPAAQVEPAEAQEEVPAAAVAAVARIPALGGQAARAQVAKRMVRTGRTLGRLLVGQGVRAEARPKPLVVPAVVGVIPAIRAATAERAALAIAVVRPLAEAEVEVVEMATNLERAAQEDPVPVEEILVKRERMVPTLQRNVEAP